MSTPEVQAVEREMAPRLAAFADRITQNEKLFARIAGGLRDPRELRSHPRAAAPRLARLHQLRARRGEARRGRPRSGCRRSTSASRPCSRSSARTCWPTRPTTSSSSTTEADLAGLPPSLRAAASAAAESRGHAGKWAILNTRSSMEPFLTYSDRRDLREKVWRTYFSRGRQRRRARQQRRHHRDPDAARRAGEADRLSDPRPPPARELDGEDARSARSSSWRRSGSRRWRASTKRSPTCRRSPRASDACRSPSSPGTTATTPRRCARSATTSTRTRSSRTCSSRSCARGCSGWRASSSACASRRSPTCRSITPTSGSGR